MRVRELLRRFSPYQWEPSTEELARQFGLKPEEVLRFDTNTSPYPPAKALEAITRRLTELRVNEYPETTYARLRGCLAEYLNVKREQIVVTAGADEALDIIAKTFIDAGTKSLVSSPTYSMYRVSIEALGGAIVHVNRRRDFSDDAEALRQGAMDTATRLVLLCSPNNPTGNATREEDLKRLLEQEEVPILVDESYAEFWGNTFVGLTASRPNLIIIRTFSKAFGLAGVRVGYIVAHEETVSLLNMMRPPNSLSVVSLAIAEEALKHRESMEASVRRIQAERTRLFEGLKAIPGVTPYPSEANFILSRIEGRSPQEIYQKLLKGGIVVREFKGQRELESCLRFTVRKPEENARLLAALSRVMESPC